MKRTELQKLVKAIRANSKAISNHRSRYSISSFDSIFIDSEGDWHTLGQNNFDISFFSEYERFEPIKIEQEFVFSQDILARIISTDKSKDYTFVLLGDRLIINRKWEIKLNTDCYPFAEMELPKDTILLDPYFNEKLKTALKFIGHDDLRPNMKNVCWRNGKMYATDAHIAVRIPCEMPVGYETSEIALNANIINPTSMYSEGKKFAFLSDNGCRTIMKNAFDKEEYGYYRFPDVDAVWPSHHRQSMQVDRKMLTEIINFSKIMSNPATYQVVFETDSVNGVLKISSEDVDYGYSYKESIECEYLRSAEHTNDTEEFRFGLNARFASIILANLRGEKATILIEDPKRAITFIDTDGAYPQEFLIMPIMLDY